MSHSTHVGFSCPPITSGSIGVPLAILLPVPSAGDWRSGAENAASYCRPRIVAPIPAMLVLRPTKADGPWWALPHLYNAAETPLGSFSRLFVFHPPLRSHPARAPTVGLAYICAYHLHLMFQSHLSLLDHSA